jgi:hypothetical protein
MPRKKRWGWFTAKITRRASTSSIKSPIPVEDTSRVVRRAAKALPIRTSETEFLSHYKKDFSRKIANNRSCHSKVVTEGFIKITFKASRDKRKLKREESSRLSGQVMRASLI